ncbi:hypothetical protein [Streptomyces rugosispiralis]|uniref:AG1 protein n=1 Tax=Streptomyces rugosispiralis TaxID=2967341 RepID=A0ABT1VB10_9ACTN|nr:hypothetical protein [Streptomyces rugosispiralis]MCQ8194591.1 hypothetical protein [Streptomyces rugosispiralis]
MTFDDEWSQLRAAAADKQSTHMRLNRADGGGTTGTPSQGDLVVNQDDLGRVGHEAYMLHGRLKKAGDITRGAKDDGSTAKAATVLSSHHFTMGDALTTTAMMWNDQLKTLLQACAHISNHLDYTKKSHSNEDAKIAASMARRDGGAMPVSEISKYYK